MRRLSTREIQLYELDILLKFVEICEKNNLRYYLSGGILLGAIRHKGFIPWDDDIDLAMPRQDFIKLINLSKHYQDDTYMFSFFDKGGNGEYLLPYGKFVNKNTLVGSRFTNDSHLRHLWIDIMPMDGLPNNLEEVKKIYNQVEIYRSIIKLCNARLGEGKNSLKKIAKYILKPIALLYGKERAISKINTLSMQYDYETSTYVGAVSCGLYGIGERMLKEDVDNSTQVEFEKHWFTSFRCWDSYLKGLYGNYMKLPPEDKRKTHDMTVWVEE